MDDHTKKLNPLQGISLLFFLLALPVGIYFYQTQNVGETRSRAGSYSTPNEGSGPTVRKLVVPVVAPVVAPATPIHTPTPTQTMFKRCNLNCTSDAACGTGMVCAQIGSEGKCRNAQCFGVDDCWCYKVETSPTPKNYCNASCTTNGDCGSAMICVQTADGNKCREPQCFSQASCICYSTLTTPTLTTPTPTEKQLVYVPITTKKITPTPTEMLEISPTPTIDLSLLTALMPSPIPPPSDLVQPEIVVDPFYNSKKQTNPNLSLSGITDPYATIEISITPDNIKGVVTADSLGNWRYLTPNALKNGEKQLTLRVMTDKGGETVKTETFTVVGAAQFPAAAIAFVLLIIVGIGGYIFFQMKKNQAPPSYPETSTEEIPPSEVSGEVTPEAPQTENESLVSDTTMTEPTSSVSEEPVSDTEKSTEPPVFETPSSPPDQYDRTSEQHLPTEWPKGTETQINPVSEPPQNS